MLTAVSTKVCFVALLVLSLLRALKPTNQQIYNDQTIHRKINAVSLLLFSTGIDSAYYEKLIDAEPFGYHLGHLTKKKKTLQLHFTLLSYLWQYAGCI